MQDTPKKQSNTTTIAQVVAMHAINLGAYIRKSSNEWVTAM
jgi:hypothetical protein